MKNLFKQQSTEKGLRASEIARGEQGFTILELMFVIAIFGIMSVVVLFGFRDFGVKTRFDNLAQDVALHIVSAQNAAINGALSTGTVGSIAPRFGVNFVSGTSRNTLDSQFIYFSDLPGTTYNSIYDTLIACGSPSSECINSTKITTGEYVDLISFVVPGGSTYTSVVPGSSANITFTRPFPDAKIIICTAPGTCNPPVSNVYIELATPSDATLKKTIVVNALGTVRVYNGSTSCAHSGIGGC